MTALEPGTLFALIDHYASLGIHRTGSAADVATDKWICSWLAERGIDARREAFAFSKVEVRTACVISERLSIEGVPLHDGGTTGALGAEGPLVKTDAISTESIVLLEPASVDALISGVAQPRGAIVVSGDPDGYVRLRNAERMAYPFALPVLQVATRDAAQLLPLAGAGKPVRLLIDRDIVSASAGNVVADIPARGPDGWVVLMTPKSGWYQCAAERGGGIAIAMALAESIQAMPNRRKHVRLLFTSGHELGHRGLLAHLEQDPALRHRASFWLQLGASIGAREAAGMRVFTREAPLREWFMKVLTRHGAGPVSLAPVDLRPHGESREVFDHPFLSLAGAHPRFHSPQDIAERTVDAQSVARFGRAFVELLERVLR